MGNVLKIKYLAICFGKLCELLCDLNVGMCTIFVVYNCLCALP